ncbi:MAG TPA: nucleoside-diphosphate sugar epimerase/dehydratase [Candidatus Acidoferrum sp.]|nr:nucleoside-diphosphate sugar epimerase/dehydratase [Candidatus Acidoferrum sp.]
MLLNRTNTRLARFYTRSNQIIMDAALWVVSLSAAFLVRGDGRLGAAELAQLLAWMPIVVLGRLALFSRLGMYRLIWRFVSISDAIRLTRSFAASVLPLLTIAIVYPRQAPLSAWIRIPASTLVLEGLLALFASLAVRAFRRIQYINERRHTNVSKPSKRVLLYGAGRAGMMLRREIENNPVFDVVGFIDDDPDKVGSVISDTLVLGRGDDLESLVREWRVDEVIITMATASRSTLAQALAKCRRSRIPAKIIPSLREILGGQVQISDLRDTKVEEVLGRESIEVGEFEILAGPTYRGRRVLVTGAGGSIGSELVRQLWRLNPSRIAILDKDENAIYELDQESRRRNVAISLDPHIADARDHSRLRAIFSEFRPQVVFHAAAHKHVPLMEMQPCEAVLNNVGGTRNVLEASSESSVERFVFISSDKAVNPVNVMGATKRIGEMLVQTELRTGHMRYACVRFGNVLGSRGSVVPLFKKQIADGGPVTVTHPDIVRYFMTIQEAVQLILCAGTLASRGEVFVLDMGRLRNILELAREMILLSGLEPEKDVFTTITGLRPGEKLTEELVAPFEKLSQTHIEKISMIEPRAIDRASFSSGVAELLESARRNDRRRLLEIFDAMELGYRSSLPRVHAAAAGSLLPHGLIPGARTAVPQRHDAAG